MKETNPTGSATIEDADLIRPEDLHHISEDTEMAKLREAMEQEKKRAAQQQELYDAFMNQHIRPDAKERFTARLRDAAQRGEHEIELLRFSSEFCSDGGRRINNYDPEWHVSLTGFAKEVYDAYDQHLRPLGYKMHARILNYPDGMPGDVGIFLSW